MKILWHSTAPWSPSSYSVLTARAVPGLVKAGHQVAIGTWYGLQGQPLPWTIQDKKTGEPIARVDVFPSGDGAQFSQDILRELYQYIKADVLITCSDVWPFKREITAKTVFCPWLPIDHDPTPGPILDALESATYPMVYSRWGTEILKQSGINAHYVPCSAPGDVFKPANQTAAREMLGITDKAKFLVGMVAANKDPHDRKGLSEGLQAFAKFAQRHEDAYLYLHTNVRGMINVMGIADNLGIKKRVIQCDPLGYALGMLDTNYMVMAYNACNVLLNLAKSEGFGLPILEAQMCGVPVIATDFSTTNEMLWAGWKVQGQPDWSPGLDSWRITADINLAALALDSAYKERNNKTLKQQARRGALSLDTERVSDIYWKPALKEIDDLISRKPVFSIPKSEPEREAVAA